MASGTPGLLFRMRHAMMVCLISLALFLLSAVTGCEDKEEEPKVYYGPAPIDALDAGSGDVTALEDIPAVYYGPQPTDVIDVAPDVGTELPAVYYGPQPIDVPDASVLPDVGPDIIASYYGPQPTDVIDLDSPATDCMMAAYYGPQPCETDEQCVEWEGPGWYCNTDNTYPDGCGGTVSWPICEPPQ